MSIDRKKQDYDEQDAVKWIRNVRVKAPDGLLDRVMEALPDAPDKAAGNVISGMWPLGKSWIMPALAGAAASFIFMAGVLFCIEKNRNSNVLVTFELKSPGAEKVELVGSFNHWQPGTVVLEGPDANGKWSATIELPKGRHEYMFLVNGGTWVTDPSAPVKKSDGFGLENAIIEI